MPQTSSTVDHAHRSTAATDADTVVVATGVPCRQQIFHGTGTA